jgi:endoglucanase
MRKLKHDRRFISVSATVVMASVTMFSAPPSIGGASAGVPAKPVAKVALADGAYTITSSCVDKQLGLKNGNPNPWDKVVLADAGSRGAISWQVKAEVDGSYTLRAKDTNSVLQTAYSGTASGTSVDLWTDVGAASQRWMIDDTGLGTVRLRLASATNMLLDAQASGANGETNVWLYPDGDTCSQRWRMQRTDVAGSTAEAFAMLNRLGRGVNYGDALEGAPNEGAWGLTLNDELFDKAKEGKFATIRLPVRWSSHAQPQAPYTIDEAFFQRVDYAINATGARGMNIVINMHHYRQLCDEALDYNEASVPGNVHEDRFVAMWGQIAQRYKDQPTNRVLFELYNEPNTGCTSPRWNALLKRAFAEVRQTNLDRFVVIGPASWNNAEALKDFAPPDDPRVIVSVHNYSPFKFTHQGAGWIPGADAWLGTTCCSAAQVAELVAPMDIVQRWAGTRWPIWVGEFGSNQYGAYDSRVRYTRIIRDEMEKRGFSWAYWELASNFGIWDPVNKSWRTELRDALTGQ